MNSRSIIDLGLVAFGGRGARWTSRDKGMSSVVTEEADRGSVERIPLALPHRGEKLRDLTAAFASDNLGENVACNLVRSDEDRH